LLQDTEQGYTLNITPYHDIALSLPSIVHSAVATSYYNEHKLCILMSNIYVNVGVLEY